ncbi:MAG: hypothetical protein ACK56F_26640, partial [bacterium]
MRSSSAGQTHWTPPFTFLAIMCQVCWLFIHVAKFFLFYGVFLPEHGPVARHFAYQVLQHAVSLNWAALDPAVKANFKTVAI